MLFYKGRTFEIRWAADAKESQATAYGHADENCIAQLNRMIERFADHGKLHSPEQMNNEGDGIYAIKARCGLRAYGWYHSSIRGVFVISHFICKKKQKLDSADLDRSNANRRTYES